MSSSGNPEPDELVFRRARPKDFADEPFERGILSPLPELFIPRQGQGLSVFLTSMSTPRAVLQHHIDTCRERMQNGSEQDRKSAERMICRDVSVEHMVELGWRVIELPLSSFGRDKFTYTKPSVAEIDRGHFEIFGEPDFFEIHSLIARRASRVLTPNECLATQAS